MKRKGWWLIGGAAFVCGLTAFLCVTGKKAATPRYEVRTNTGGLILELIEPDGLNDRYEFTVRDPEALMQEHVCGSLFPHAFWDQSHMDYALQITAPEKAGNTLLYLARTRDGAVQSVETFRLSWRPGEETVCEPYQGSDPQAEWAQYRENRDKMENKEEQNF